MNVIDVLAILPYYVSLFLMGEDEVIIIITIVTASSSSPHHHHYHHHHDHHHHYNIHHDQVKLTTTTTVSPIATTISPEDEGTSFDDVRRIIQGDHFDLFNELGDNEHYDVMMMIVVLCQYSKSDLQFSCSLKSA